MKERSTNIAFLDVSESFHMELTAKLSRNSMFGLSLPIYRSRKRNTLDDFDGIRSILSRSKCQENWGPYVHKQGDLFYLDVKQDNKSKYQQRGHVSDWSSNHHVEQSLNSGNSYTHSGDHSHLENNNQPLYTKSSAAETKYNKNEVQVSGSGYKHFKPKILFSDQNMLKENDFNSENCVESDTHKKLGNGQILSSSCPPSEDKIKHVYLVPNIRNCCSSDKSGIILCEKLFGIVLCQYNQRTPQHMLNGSTLEKLARERKIIVQDVLQASPAKQSAQIFRGDMLVCLNDIELTWVNLDEIFRSITNRPVKLTFQLPVVIGPDKNPPPSRVPPPLPPKTYPHKVSTCTVVPTSPHQPPKKQRPQLGDNILQLVSGEDKSRLVLFLKNIMCAVMYLTLDSPEPEESSENTKEDIVYQFPCDLENKLVDVRGLFLTLCGTVPDITGNNVKCCTISHKGQTIHVVFIREGQDLFLMGFPQSRVPLAFCEVVMKEMHRLLKVLFGSVVSAFRSPKFRVQLDQLFSLTLHTVLLNPDIIQHGTNSSIPAQVFFESITGAQRLILTQENMLLCDEILSEFEAADFDEFMEEEDLFERRTFTVLGTCLYYKEYLLCNHLPVSDFQDVHLFVKYHSLLQLMGRKSVEDLVIWREMFPTRRCHCREAPPPGYTEPTGHWFLLLVGMKHFLLGTLLEMGGCTKTRNIPLSPDPFYVSQAKATLLQFETDDVAMAQCCEKRLTAESSGPTLVSADSMLLGIKSKKEDGSFISPAKVQESPKSPTILSPTYTLLFKWPLSPNNDTNTGLTEESSDQYRGGSNSDVSTPIMKRHGSRLSYGSNDSAGSGSSSGPHNKGKLGSKSGSVFDVNSNNSAIHPEPYKVIRVTRGCQNTLFHAVQFDSVEGVFISPTPQAMAVSQGHLHGQVLFNFYKSCLQIRNSFHSNLPQQAKLNPRNLKWGVNSMCLQEQGLLFSYVQPQENKKTPITLTYWVVGRILQQDKELYVCFHESIPQSTVELAFRVGFGT
ncbi:protein inturned-like isoform X2 [Saccostrea echinata]|uniref:protein inturned-like isoform X2 n=1 Tax=Saccostrea echinata TaxID=191078 RepID=UPI002A7F1345|nr:protein inturned-like isoform X2 [Saccostrea echinata]